MTDTTTNAPTEHKVTMRKHLTIAEVRGQLVRRITDPTAFVTPAYEDLVPMLDDLVRISKGAQIDGVFRSKYFENLHTWIGSEFARAGLVSKHTNRDRTDYIARVVNAVLDRTRALLGE